MKTSRFVVYWLSPAEDSQDDGNDEVSALPVGMTVRSREEVLESLSGDFADDVCVSSDEAIRTELDKLYAERPDLFAEHLRKQGQARVAKRLETTKRLQLTPRASARLIGAALHL
jgi:hypothetical protein